MVAAHDTLPHHHELDAPALERDLLRVEHASVRGRDKNEQRSGGAPGANMSTPQQDRHQRGTQRSPKMGTIFLNIHVLQHVT